MKAGKAWDAGGNETSGQANAPAPVAPLRPAENVPEATERFRDVCGVALNMLFSNSNFQSAPETARRVATMPSIKRYATKLGPFFFCGKVSLRGERVHTWNLNMGGTRLIFAYLAYFPRGAMPRK